MTTLLFSGRLSGKYRHKQGAPFVAFDRWEANSLRGSPPACFALG